jgi:hypothetical protein
VAGLDFSEPDRGYTSLTGLSIWIVDPDGLPANGCRPAAGTIICERPHRPTVVAYDPASSRLVNMLRARGAPRMPPDRALPEADIALIERWILDGARQTPDGPPAPTDPYAPSNDAGADAAADAAAERAAGDATDAADAGDAAAQSSDARDGGIDSAADGGGDK